MNPLPDINVVSGGASGHIAMCPYNLPDMNDRELRPNRKSVRLAGYDYAGPGSIFFTICTDNRALFGNVFNLSMECNALGDIAQKEWLRTLEIRREITAHAFIVMPNHVHGLVSINPEEASRQWMPAPDLANDEVPLHVRRRPQSLSTMIAGYKAAVTCAARNGTLCFAGDIWQRNYHERVVRNQQEFEVIESYIKTNPAKWNEDRFNPAL